MAKTCMHCSQRPGTKYWKPEYPNILTRVAYCNKCYDPSNLLFKTLLDAKIHIVTRIVAGELE